MPWAIVMLYVCIGLVVLSLVRWASFFLTMQADIGKEKESMKTNQFMLLGSALVETIWTMGTNIASKCFQVKHAEI